MSEAVGQESADASAGSRPLFAPMPLPLLYLYTVASFGMYALVWFARAGRVSRARLGRGPHPFWWGAGALVPFIGGVALHRLEERSGRFAAEEGLTPRRTSPVAGLLYFGLGALSARAPNGFAVAALLLLPIPLLLVQRRFNWGWRGARDPVSVRAVPRFSVWRGVLATAGVACVGMLFWFGDRAGLAAAFGHHLRADERVESERAAYSVAVPSALWSRVATGTVGDADADFELHAVGSDAWVVTYVISGTQHSLDSLVDARRILLEDKGSIRAREERRRFADSLGFVPMSLVNYEFASWRKLFFSVATVQLDDRVIEVVGSSEGTGRWRDEVRQIVESVAVKGASP